MPTRARVRGGRITMPGPVKRMRDLPFWPAMIFVADHETLAMTQRVFARHAGAGRPMPRLVIMHGMPGLQPGAPRMFPTLEEAALSIPPEMADRLLEAVRVAERRDVVDAVASKTRGEIGRRTS